MFVSSCRLNGREFYAFGPAYKKIHSPNLSFSCGVTYGKLLADKVSLLFFKPYKKLDYSIPVWFNFSKKWFNRLFMDYFSIHWLMVGDVPARTDFRSGINYLVGILYAVLSGTSPTATEYLCHRSSRYLIFLVSQTRPISTSPWHKAYLAKLT